MTFVSVPNIFDNVFVSFELIHNIRKSRATSEEAAFLGLKLDLRLEWVYIKVVMKFMGFPNRIIEIVIRLILMTKIAIRINKGKTPYFQPTRDLRQGGPSITLAFCHWVGGILVYSAIWYSARDLAVASVMALYHGYILLPFCR